MSVKRSDWILIGADIGIEHYDNLDDNKQMGLLDGKYNENHKIGDITYLIDGMSGEYFIVGKLIAVDKDGYNGFPLRQFNLTSGFEDEKEVVSHHIYEQFGVVKNPKLIVLTHWT